MFVKVFSFCLIIILLFTDIQKIKYKIKEIINKKK